MPDKQKNSDPKVGQTFFEDLRRGDFFKNIKRDFKDLKEFYIDEGHQKQLSDMNRIKRWFFFSVWLFKSLFFKLTPTRRLLVVAGVIFLFIGGNSGIPRDGQIFLFVLILIFVLMLELKDKMLARSELEAGRSVQFALMPEESPQVSGWDIWLFTTPANDVGGDLVDFLKIDETRYGVALGDVAGKGLGAALFMAKLQATIRALAPDYPKLTDLASKINQIFHRDATANKFASLIYLVLSPDSDEIRMLNAGHFPPYLIRKSKIEEHKKGDPALGIMQDTQFKEHTIKIKPGEGLCVYSDGVTEAMNEQEMFFGDARLHKIIEQVDQRSAKETGQKILRQIHAFIGDASLTDDLSMIILYRR